MATRPTTWRRRGIWRWQGIWRQQGIWRWRAAAHGGPSRHRPASFLLTVLLLLLAGCAGTAAAPSPARPTSVVGNTTDVMFLQMTLEQHDRAAALLRLAADRARRPEVRTLAAAIAATQRTEARTMTDWLRGWDRPLTVDARAHRAHDTAHGGYDVLRGTTPDDVDLLASTGPDEFDRNLLNILVAHQHNAVELARMQHAGGAHPGVSRFATLVERSRTAQIEHMLTLLAGAGASDPP